MPTQIYGEQPDNLSDGGSGIQVCIYAGLGCAGKRGQGAQKGQDPERFAQWLCNLLQTRVDSRVQDRGRAGRRNAGGRRGHWQGQQAVRQLPRAARRQPSKLQAWRSANQGERCKGVVLAAHAGQPGCARQRTPRGRHAAASAPAAKRPWSLAAAGPARRRARLTLAAALLRCANSLPLPLSCSEASFPLRAMAEGRPDCFMHRRSRHAVSQMGAAPQNWPAAPCTEKGPQTAEKPHAA